MASYPPTILPAQENFAQNLLGGVVRSFISNKMQEGVDAKKQKILEEREAKKNAEIIKQMALAKADPNMDVTESYTSDGPRFLASPRKVDVMTAYKHVVSGLATPEEQELIGKRTGVQKPPAEVPGMSMMDGSVGNIPNPDSNYSDAIRKSMLPNYSKEQIVANMAGLPQLKKTTTESGSFEADLKDAIAGANDDETIFVESLKGLSRKYAMDPVAQKHIKELMAVNARKTPQTEADLFGGSDWK